MARILRMPGVAANTTEAVLAEWLVKEYDDFATADPIATVETEKAAVDIEADAAGRVLKTLVSAGAHVEVGDPIAVIGEPGEQAEDLDAVLASLGVAPTPHVRVFASPLARRIAKDAGLRLEEIGGTGPRGRVLRRDVDAAVAARATRAEPTQAPAVQPTSSTVGAAYEEVPHSRIRLATARRLVESVQQAPHFYMRATVRAEPLLALRDELNEDHSSRVSLNDLVVKAVAAAHQRVPEMNVTWTADSLRRYVAVDVGVAVATDRGLLTPVVRDVGSLTLTALARSVRDLADRARNGALRQDELEGGTIAVTNLGMYGVEEFAAIINPPQSAILAVGAVRDEPVVEDGAVVAGKVMTVTLSVDHRPVDGVLAARWLSVLGDLLEHPARALA